MFYGMIIYLYNMDNVQHKMPHLHIKFEGNYSAVSIPDCEILNGDLPSKKLNILKAWVTIHEDELMANWDLAINGEAPYKIEPLK